jgi:hypothetical protein
MALVRAKAGGYSSGGEVTATQINTIDRNAGLAVRRADTGDGYRVVPMAWIGSTTGAVGPLATVSSAGVVEFYTGSAVAGAVYFGLSLPHDHSVQGVQAVLKLGSGHTDIPPISPNVRLISKVATATTGTSLTVASFSTCTTAGYDNALVYLSATCSSTVAAGTTHYIVRVRNESGAGAVGGMKVLSIRLNMQFDTASGVSHPSLSCWV